MWNWDHTDIVLEKYSYVFFFCSHFCNLSALKAGNQLNNTKLNTVPETGQLLSYHLLQLKKQALNTQIGRCR